MIVERLKNLIESEAMQHGNPTETWHVAYEAIQEIEKLEHQLFEANTLLDTIRRNARMADLMSWYLHDKLEAYFNEIQN